MAEQATIPKITIRSDWPETTWLRMACVCGKGVLHPWAAGSIGTALHAAAAHQRDDHGVCIAGDVEGDWHRLICEHEEWFRVTRMCDPVERWLCPDCMLIKEELP